MSPTATTSKSLPNSPCSCRARKKRRPIRPKPLMAIRVLISAISRQAFDVCKRALYMTWPTAPSNGAKTPTTARGSARHSVERRSVAEDSVLADVAVAGQRRRADGGVDVRGADQRADGRRLRAAAGRTARDAELALDAIGGTVRHRPRRARGDALLQRRE